MVAEMGEDFLILDASRLTAPLRKALAAGTDVDSDHNRVFVNAQSHTGTLASYKKVYQNLIERPLNNAVASKIFDGDRILTKYRRLEQDIRLFNPDLDQAKVKAVKKCLQADCLAMIHGPPGTGKTTALAEVILQHAVRGQRVLAAAPSHAACDALTLAIIKHWPHDLLGDPVADGKFIRIAQKLRITSEEVRPYLQENSVVAQNYEWIEKTRERKCDLFKDILTAGSAKGLSPVMDDLEVTTEDLNKCNSHLIDECSKNAQIVVTTATSSLKFGIQRLLKRSHFDLVTLDEAGFTTDLQTMPLLTLSKRMIMAGDHKQLPPVVLSSEAAEAGLDVSMLEKITSLFPNNVSFLSTQFRSHGLISGWSSGHFYEDRLTAHPSVAATQLADLPGVRDSVETRTPFLFIDTKGSQFYEHLQIDDSVVSEEDQSITNYNEAFVIEQLVKKYVSLGVKSTDIGVITPYWAQVSVIRSLLWDPECRGKYDKIEVRTVDGFQGREKEVILLSFVRSNPERKIGFLRESRRINVSVTRAKKCCIMVGDSETLTWESEGLKSLLEYCHDQEAVVHVDEVM